MQAEEKAEDQGYRETLDGACKGHSMKGGSADRQTFIDAPDRHEHTRSEGTWLQH